MTMRTYSTPAGHQRRCVERPQGWRGIGSRLSYKLGDHGEACLDHVNVREETLPELSLCELSGHEPIYCLAERGRERAVAQGSGGKLSLGQWGGWVGDRIPRSGQLSTHEFAVQAATEL